MTVSPLGGLLPEGSDAPDTPPHVTGTFDGDHVLVPLLTAEGSVVADQLEVAASLARASGATLSVVDPTSAPRGAPETIRPETVDDSLTERAGDRIAGSATREDAVVYTRDLVAGVLRTVGTADVDTLVLPSSSRAGRVRTGLVDRIGAQADCDVVVVNGQARYRSVASVLLPVAGGPHSGLAADLARAVAADSGAWVDVLHVVGEEAPDWRRETARELVADISTRVARPETTTTWILEADDPAEAIVDHSPCYDLTVIGAPTKGRLRQFIHGSTSQAVRENARSVVLAARSNSHPPDSD